MHNLSMVPFLMDTVGGTMNILKTSFFVLFLAGMTLTFQNCNKVQSTDLGDSSLQKSGGGDGYLVAQSNDTLPEEEMSAEEMPAMGAADAADEEPPAMEEPAPGNRPTREPPMMKPPGAKHMGDMGESDGDSDKPAKDGKNCKDKKNMAQNEMGQHGKHERMPHPDSEDDSKKPKSDRGSRESNSQVICILEGPGQSRHLALADDDQLASQNATPQAICMSRPACEEMVSRKFKVKGTKATGYCKDKENGGNPNVIKMSDEQIAEKLGIN